MIAPRRRRDVRRIVVIGRRRRSSDSPTPPPDPPPEPDPDPGAGTYDYLIQTDADWATIPAGLLTGGGEVAVASGTYTSKTLLNLNPSSTLRIKAANPASKPVIDRLVVNTCSRLDLKNLVINTASTTGGGSVSNTSAIRFLGTNTVLSFTDCEINVNYMADITDTMFWSPLPSTLYGMISQTSGTTNGLTFDGCTFDGGLVSFEDGGRADVNNSLSFNSWCTSLIVRDCTIQNVYTGMFLSMNGFAIEGCTFNGRHADGIVFTNSSTHCENGIVRNNHFMNHFGDPGNFHMDHIQIQPANNSNYVRNIEVYGNTASAGELLMPQPDRAATDLIYTFTSSFTVDDTLIGRETRVAPTGSPMTVTLPSAAASAGKQFCFRYTGSSGVVSFAFNGSDTWEGGTPVLDAAGEWATFVSDGTSQWKRLRRGYRSWYLLRTASTTLGSIENNLIVNIDATAGNVDITLPDNGNQTYAIRRMDFSANTVRVLTTGGDTINHNGGSVTSITFVPGYSIDITGNGSGTWTSVEDPVTNQAFFANAHPNGLYENIKIYGNVWYGSSVGFRIEQDVPGLRVYNNTFLRPFIDDRNADGYFGPFELSGDRNMDMDIRGATAYAWNNLTVGNVVLSSGTVPAQDIGSQSLLITDTDTVPSSLTTRFNGTLKSAYRPQTRSEVLTSALAKTSGPLDGTFIGALGTSLTNGFYNFTAGEVNTSALPAPTISGSDPLDGGTISQDADITLTMSQFCEAGTGNVTIRNVTDNTTHELFNVATGVGSAGGTITFSGRTVTLNPANAMTSGKAFALRVDAGAIVGHYGKALAAISDDTTLNWTTSSAPSTFPIVIVDGDRLNRASTLTGVSGTKQLFVAAWHGYRTGGGTPSNFIELDGIRDFRVQWLGTGEIRVNAGTCSFRIPSGGATTDNETHILTVDTSQTLIADGVKYYRNGSEIDTSTFTSVSWNPGTNVDFGSTVQNTIFNGSGAANAWTGQCGFVYFDMPSSLIDIDDSAIRAKFTPSQIGSDGSGPSGTSPLIYMSGNAAYWNTPTNSGTGGTFTATGTFADA